MQKKVYIIHGYMGSPKAHWFPWLTEHLTNDGFLVNTLAMPDPQCPTPQKWISFLNDKVLELDQHTYFIAHSLGCVATLLYLSQKKIIHPIGGIILVSGFIRNLPNIPELNIFMEIPIEMESLISCLKNRVCIAAKDDYAVNFKETLFLSNLLQSEFILLEKGGHFLSQDGFNQFPEVYQTIKKNSMN